MAVATGASTFRSRLSFVLSFPQTSRWLTRTLSTYVALFFCKTLTVHCEYRLVARRCPVHCPTPYILIKIQALLHSKLHFAFPGPAIRLDITWRSSSIVVSFIQAQNILCLAAHLPPRSVCTKVPSHHGLDPDTPSPLYLALHSCLATLLRKALKHGRALASSGPKQYQSC